MAKRDAHRCAVGLMVFLLFIAATGLGSAQSPTVAYGWGWAMPPMMGTMGYWDEKPGDADYAVVYPKGAHGVGAVKLRCVVDDGGALHDCSVQSELPGGSGFGQAALLLMPRFKMDPLTVDRTKSQPHYVNFEIYLQHPGESNAIDPRDCLPPSCWLIPRAPLPPQN